MKNLSSIFLIVLIVFLVLAALYQEQRQEEQQKTELKSYVNSAAQLVEAQGESSFPELRSSKWFKGDRYIFVWKMDGLRVVYPPDPQGENKNMADLKDSNGKPIGRLFIQAAENGEGWVEYMWPKPGEKTPSKKITYIKRAQYQNQTYLVGSGIYIS